jgi:hypothetical protein
MPRDIVMTVYTFDELPTEKAKEAARDWWRDGIDSSWSDESLDSIKAFCAQFGVKLSDWSVGPYAPFHYRADHDNSNFRGVKLRDLARENYPTGYCLDADLSIAFYDHFKANGDAKAAFDHALNAGFKSWRDDMEWQLSDEAVDDALVCNDYDFDENGNRV